jgi:hypothetical protein
MESSEGTWVHNDGRKLPLYVGGNCRHRNSCATIQMYPETHSDPCQDCGGFQRAAQQPKPHCLNAE